MPFAVRKKGDEFCVINTETNEEKGCSETREKAQAHMRALYANTDDVKSKSIDYWDVHSAQISQSEANYGPLRGQDEKACANCRWFRSPDGCILVAGDISPTGLSDRWEEIPVYTMDPIPVKIVEGEVNKEEERLGVLETSVTPEQQSLIQKAFDLGRELFGRETQGMIKLREDDPSGQLRVIMPYTNNFQDRHKEIYARESHKEYEHWADENNSYPELRLWHVPGSRWGQCDYVAYDDNSGFGFVSGLVDPGCEHIARSLAKSRDIGVSNSAWAVQKDDTVLRYYCYEVSPLPLQRAGNIWHEGVKLLEDTMALDPVKRAWLAEHAGEDFVSKIEKDYEARAQQLNQDRVISKDDEGGDSPPDPPPVAQPVGGLTLEDLQTTLQAVVDPLVKRIDDIESKHGEISKSIDERAEQIFGEQLPAGYVASEKNRSNAPEGDSPNYEWLKSKKSAFALEGDE